MGKAGAHSERAHDFLRGNGAETCCARVSRTAGTVAALEDLFGGRTMVAFKGLIPISHAALLVALLPLLSGWSGCNGAICKEGTEDCSCTSDDRCEAGLVCEENVCRANDSGEGGTDGDDPPDSDDDDDAGTAGSGNAGRGGTGGADEDGSAGTGATGGSSEAGGGGGADSGIGGSESSGGSGANTSTGGSSSGGTNAGGTNAGGMNTGGMAGGGVAGSGGSGGSDCGEVTYWNLQIYGLVHSVGGQPLASAHVVLKDRVWSPGSILGETATLGNGRFELNVLGVPSPELCWDILAYYVEADDHGTQYGEVPLSDLLQSEIEEAAAMGQAPPGVPDFFTGVLTIEIPGAIQLVETPAE
jgi:hypothetical protein